MTYSEWVRAHPRAAVDLAAMLAPDPWAEESDCDKSESWAQQKVRLDVAKTGAMAWRNNVGATKAIEQHFCPACNHHYETRQQPVRYGLANDSAKMNKKIKSSDLVLAIPRLITPAMVGTTMAQFGCLEVKRPGWTRNFKDEHENAQAKWLQIILQLGGYAKFTTGKVEL